MMLHNENEVTADLVNSIVMKLDIEATYMNHQLYIAIGDTFVLPDDRSEWIYYMNMAGLPHYANTEMVMQSLDTSLDFVITKESLLEHPKTKIELLRYGPVFDYTLEDNGNQVSLLRGMLNPMDIDKVINADDGEILDFDSSVFSYREDNLITDIEFAVRQYIDRWYNELLAFEDRYIPTVLAQVHTVVLMAISNSRLDAINTESASDENVIEHLRSCMATNNILKYLSDTTKLWLYKNVKRLMKLTASDITLQTIVEEICIPAGIEVSDIRYTKPLVELQLDVDNIESVPWTTENIVEVISRDPKSSDKFNRVINEDQYLDSSLALTNLSLAEGIAEIKETRKLLLGVNQNMLTKSIMISNDTFVTPIESKIDILVFENWMVSGLKGEITKASEIDLGLDGVLTLSSRDGALLYLYLYLKKNNLDTDGIHSFKTRSVMVNAPSLDTLIMKSSRDISVRDLVDELIPLKPVKFYDDDFEKYLNDLIILNQSLWALESSTSEEINQRNMSILTKHLFNYDSDTRMTTHILFNGNTLNLEQELNYRNVPTEYKNLDTVMAKVFLEFTGRPVDIAESNRDRLLVFKAFMTKFISYNVNIITPENRISHTGVNRSINLIRGLDASLILGTNLEPLEHYPVTGVMDGISVRGVEAFPSIHNQVIQYDKNVGNITYPMYKGIQECTNQVMITRVSAGYTELVYSNILGTVSDEISTYDETPLPNICPRYTTNSNYLLPEDIVDYECNEVLIYYRVTPLAKPIVETLNLESRISSGIWTMSRQVYVSDTSPLIKLSNTSDEIMSYTTPAYNDNEVTLSESKLFKLTYPNSIYFKGGIIDNTVAPVNSIISTRIIDTIPNIVNTDSPIEGNEVIMMLEAVVDL